MPATMATSMSSPRSVPSITLQITKDDADRFLDACKALELTLQQGKDAVAAGRRGSATEGKSEGTEERQDERGSSSPSTTISATESSGAGADPRSLHKVLHEAALKCRHPVVVAFLDRMTSSGIPLSEVQAGTLLFHNALDKSAKLKHFFRVFAGERPGDSGGTAENSAADSVDHQGAVSLFRSALTAISSVVQQAWSHHHGVSASGESSSLTHGDVIVEGKPASPPKKRFKRDDNETATTHKQLTEDARTERTNVRAVKNEEDYQDVGVTQGASFDSSLATLADDQEHLRREIEEIASYAADELFRFAGTIPDAKAKDGEGGGSSSTADVDEPKISFTTFGEWYNATGKSVVPWLELLNLSKWRNHSRGPGAKHPFDDNRVEADPRSPGSLIDHEDSSPSLISFDFSASITGTTKSPSNAGTGGSSLSIDISEDNLIALNELVHRTGLIHRPAADVCKTLMAFANRKTSSADKETLLTLTRDDFRRALDRLIPKGSMDGVSKQDRDSLYESLLDVFWMFQGSGNRIGEDEVDLKEIAVGLCFFCSGSKSTKLATGFELLDDKRRGYLTEVQLFGYLRSYLLSLVALSFLKPLSKKNQRRVLSKPRRTAVLSAVESGAKWTLGHFLAYFGPQASSERNSQLSFESFAHWYSTGGFNIAPWLELLDLNKVFSLINESASPVPLAAAFPEHSFQTATRRPQPKDRMSSLRRHHSVRRPGQPPPEVLFSFPLASQGTLVVLKEDAKYVRDVVDTLGLLSMTPDALWAKLSKAAEKRRKTQKSLPKQQHQDEVAVYVDSSTFVDSVQEVTPRSGRKRSSPGSSASHTSAPEILSNFFHCFDFDQVDSVALDELMGGLTLLCGGKKSMKLSFAFSIFDTRPEIQKKKRKKGQPDIVHSLRGEDLFLFLRSILTVTFSCCRQSLELEDADVSRCIADTANMICNDVMRHQWEKKRLDRVNFDEFGQWYNEGGFERAPWLELLDLKKWVLVDNVDAIEKRDPGGPGMPIPAPSSPPSLPSNVPPPPPEDALDPAFFDEHMPIDSVRLICFFWCFILYLQQAVS